MRDPTFGEVWERLEDLRRGVEKDQRIIADLKFRKAELERMLLEARQEATDFRAALVRADNWNVRQRENVERLERVVRETGSEKTRAQTRAAETAAKDERERCVTALYDRYTELRDSPCADEWDKGYEVGYVAAIEDLRGIA